MSPPPPPYTHTVLQEGMAARDYELESVAASRVAALEKQLEGKQAELEAMEAKLNEVRVWGGGVRGACAE